jgi:hypothetical protein
MTFTDRILAFCLVFVAFWFIVVPRFWWRVLTGRR